jgi:lipoyl(octanoyl) transferase
MTPLRVAWLGRVRYGDAAALQERLRAAILAGDRAAETLLLLEHEPVITLGRAAERANVLAGTGELAARGVEVVESSRGGDVTYHGPGQLVAYPVVQLQRGVVAHVHAMARAVIESARLQGVPAHFRRACPGVWIGAEAPPDDACTGGRGRKLAAFGVHVHRRVAIHGVAMNVTTALDAFSLIVPCGLAASQPTSLALESGRAVALADVIEPFAAEFCRAADRAPEFLSESDTRSLLSRSVPVE